MRHFLLALLVAFAASLSGCGARPPQSPPAAAILPPGALTPERSLRMALHDCAPFDPFRSAYLDRLPIMTEPEVSRFARSGSPAHAACMRELGWDTSSGRF
jgi:predicted small lipoprotein YifL